MNGEAYIYNLAIKSLRKKTSLQIKTQGAGRKQIKHLETVHNKRTPQSTQTMLMIWDNLQILKTETIADFRERWDELLEDMKNAEPDPLNRTDGEKRIKYLEAFEKGKRFVEEHKDFKKAHTEIEDMEKWFTQLENKGSLELLTRHSMNTEGIVNMPSAEIYSYESARKKKTKQSKKKLKCFSWEKYGKCSRGSKCKYLHDHDTKTEKSSKSSKQQRKTKKPKAQVWH